jgi:acetolactate synthase-1/2/3 large subunit
MSRAFRTATSGRPGPVVLALPEDMLTDRVAVADAPAYAPAEPELSPRAVAEIRAALETAERPMVLVGGGGWSDAAAADLRRFAEAAQLPVATSFRRQDVLDNGSDSYVGDFGTASEPGLTERLAESDLLLVIGARLGEMTTKGYTALRPPVTPQRILHIHADADEIGRVYAPDAGYVSTPGPLARALAAERWPEAPRWAGRTREMRAAWLKDTGPQPASAARLDLTGAFLAMRELLPPETVVTLDAGNHNGWAQRFLRHGRPGRQIGSTCGAMGYSVPAGVAAALVDRERPVLAVVGDGGFMMSGLELATAVQHGGALVVLLVNNESYGTIRMHQEREHPGRVSGTELQAPDFIALAESLGCHTERVTETAGAAPALERALAAGRPALVELVVEVDQISSRTTLARMAKAMAG